MVKWRRRRRPTTTDDDADRHGVALTLVLEHCRRVRRFATGAALASTRRALADTWAHAIARDEMMRVSAALRGYALLVAPDALATPEVPPHVTDARAVVEYERAPPHAFPPLPRGVVPAHAFALNLATGGEDAAGSAFPDDYVVGPRLGVVARRVMAALPVARVSKRVRRAVAERHVYALPLLVFAWQAEHERGAHLGATDLVEASVAVLAHAVCTRFYAYTEGVPGRNFPSCLALDRARQFTADNGVALMGATHCRMYAGAPHMGTGQPYALFVDMCITRTLPAHPAVCDSPLASTGVMWATTRVPASPLLSYLRASTQSSSSSARVCHHMHGMIVHFGDFAAERVGSRTSALAITVEQQPVAVRVATLLYGYCLNADDVLVEWSTMAYVALDACFFARATLLTMLATLAHVDTSSAESAGVRVHRHQCRACHQQR